MKFYKKRRGKNHDAPNQNIRTNRFDLLLGVF